MSLQSHLSELERKHNDLETRIQELSHHPSADDLEIADLKSESCASRKKSNRFPPDTEFLQGMGVSNGRRSASRHPSC